MQKSLPTTSHIDLSLYQIKDPVEFGRNLVEMMETGSKIIAEMMEKQGLTPTKALAAQGQPPEIPETAKNMAALWQNWLGDPARLSEAQGELFAGYMQLWQNTIHKIAGVDSHPVAEPEPGDNRFKDSDWTSNAYFDFWKQSYLLTVRSAEKLLQATEGMDERERHKAEFALRQVAAALSPTNFPTTNPEVIRETFRTNAANLVAGMRQLLGDLARSDKQLKISQTDTTAFEVGRNIAVTPGKVVFQNALLQLIQYTPTTEKVRAVPFLIVPPWINKFYILDLTPQKSFIKYMVDQGFTVFVVSWVNPDERLRSKTFEDYMREGILAAADAVKRETGEKKCNVLG